MTTEVETGVRPAHLLEYNNRALKLVGIGKNGLPCMKWGPIYDNPNFWTDEQLMKHAPDFYGVATVFGKTRLIDEQGPLYLNNLDIDSDAVYDKLFILLDPGPKHSLIKKLFEEGFVVKTQKTKGHHIYWFSHKQHKPIHTQDCKKGFEFEVHTDKSSGTGMLPPSRHREYPDFEYKFVIEGKIPTSDDTYDVILEVLGDCLLQKSLEDSLILEKEDSEGEKGPKEEYSGDDKNGLELEVDDIQDIVKLIQPIYTKGRRNNIVYGLSGVLRVEGICQISTSSIIEALATNDPLSQKDDVRNAPPEQLQIPDLDLAMTSSLLIL